MANNIVQAKVHIKGTRPVFWHWFGPTAIPLPEDEQERTGVAGNDPEEWRRTTLVTKDGQLFFMPTYAFATIREGSRFTKKGIGSIMTSMIATLQIVDSIVLVNRFMPGYPNGKSYDIKKTAPPERDMTQPVYLDVRMVKNPKTKSANVRYRVAAAPGWEAEFTAQWDKTVISRAQMEAVLIDAGNLVGIGNGLKIGMGRFSLEAFEVQE